MLKYPVSMWFVCKTCGFTFNFRSVDDVLNHKKKMHPSEFELLQCIVFEEKETEVRVVTAPMNPNIKDANEKADVISINTSVIDGNVVVTEIVKDMNVDDIDYGVSDVSNFNIDADDNNSDSVEEILPYALSPIEEAHDSDFDLDESSNTLVQKSTQNFNKLSPAPAPAPGSVIGRLPNKKTGQINKSTMKSSSTLQNPPVSTSTSRLNKTQFSCLYHNCSRSFISYWSLNIHKKLHHRRRLQPTKSVLKLRPKSKRKSAFIKSTSPSKNSLNQDQNSQVNFSSDPSTSTSTLIDWLKIQKQKSARKATANVILLKPDPSIEDVGPIKVTNPIRCKLCSMKLTSEEDVKLHVLNCWHHNKRRHNFCAMCNKAFGIPVYLRSHSCPGSTEPKPKDVKRKQCTKVKAECQKNRSNKNCDTLLKIVKQKKNSKALTIKRSLRSSSVKNNDANKSDKMTKSSELDSRPFACLICGFAFPKMSGLKSHIRTHSSARPFHCPEPNCSKTYKIKSDLRVHRLTHSNERPEKCTHPDCEKSFRDKKGLNTHLATHVPEELYPYKCTYPNCGRAFPRSSALTEHMKSRRAHSRIKVGDIPQGVLPTPTRTEPKLFKCKRCGETFMLRLGLYTHAKIHQIFKCTYEGCTSAFTRQRRLEDHVRTHTGERPFNCRPCKKSFHAKRAYQLHNIRVHKIEPHSNEEVFYIFC